MQQTQLKNLGLIVIDYLQLMHGDNPNENRVLEVQNITRSLKIMAKELSKEEHLIFLCGHYEGIDQRVIDMLKPEEISLGDFILTGGELAVSVICDAIIRLIPGVISDETSALSDSFQDNLLAPPVYTRPAEYNGWRVPDVLLSGHEANIRKWEFEQSLERTKLLRPDLLK